MRKANLIKLVTVCALLLSELVFTQSPAQALLPSSIEPISVGASSSCAIRSADDLYCVGSNTFGQLGNGNTTSTTDPQKVVGITGVASVSVGSNSACAVTYSGALYCWGANSGGQLGLGTNENKNTATLVTSLSNIAQVTVGTNFACALSKSSVVYCWGSNEFGQLGQDPLQSSNSPVVVSGLPSSIYSIFARGNRVCVVSTDVYCWGEFSNNSFTNGAKQYAVTKLDNSTGSLGLSLGSDFGCLKFSASVSCWGNNDHGQLGIGNKTSSNLLSPVTGITSVKQVVTGSHFACVLNEAGDTFCWGENQAGQLGIQAGADVTTRIPTGASKSAFLSSYNSTACSLKLDGYVACVGDVGAGQSGVLSSSSTALTNSVVTNVTRVSAGTNTTCVLATTLNCWGTLTPEDSTFSFDEVSVGNSSACAIASTKTLYCWGSNSSGQLGDNTTKASSSKISKVALDANFAQVSVGYRHACAVTDAGLVYCWGDNSKLQLGSIGADSRAPKAVPGIGTAVSVAVGDYHSCVQLQDSSVICWGDNSKKQINATSSSQLPPTALVVSGTVRSFALGSFNTCLLVNVAPLTTNTLNCFGDNSKKQSPGVVAGTYKSVSSGANTVCAINTQDLIYCFGAADAGKLGNLISDTSTPTKLSDVPSRLASVGGSHVCSTTLTGLLNCWGSNTTGQLTVSFGYPKAFAKPTVYISGSKALGETMTASVFSLEPNVTNTYLWTRASTSLGTFANLTSETNSTLITSGIDLGRYFTVQVRQNKWGISSPTYLSDVAGPITSQIRILLAPTPLLSGSNKVGNFLIARPGRWDSGTTFTYKWYRGSAIIKGATKSSYQLVVADIGKQISVAVTGSKAGLPKLTKKSLKTAKIIR